MAIEIIIVEKLLNENAADCKIIYKSYKRKTKQSTGLHRGNNFDFNFRKLIRKIGDTKCAFFSSQF